MRPRSPNVAATAWAATAALGLTAVAVSLAGVVHADVVVYGGWAALLAGATLTLTGPADDWLTRRRQR